MNCIRKIALVLIVTLLHKAIAFAGITDTIHSIREIEVTASRLEQYFVGASIHEIDSQQLLNFQPQSVAELLNQQSLVSVKSYGPGGVAGISIRGGASHHASVIWNGLNIQSPMLGEVNLSTLPVNFIDKAYIQYGGGTTLFGSGAVTGSIHLSDEMELNNGLKSEVASYLGMNHNYIDSNGYGISDFIQSAKISYSSKKWGSSFKFFYQNNKNDFDFFNSEKGDVKYEKQGHASYNQYGFSQSNKLLLGYKTVIGTDIWWLDFRKEIPSLMSDYETGVKDQTDKNLMYSLYYKYLGQKVKIKVQSGGFFNQVLYNDPLSNPGLTNNRSFSSISLSELRYSVSNNLQLGIILEYKNERGASDYYSDWKIRNIVSPIFSILFENSKLKAMANFREDNVNGSFIPFVFSAGVDFNLIKGLSLKAHLSKNYTLPTLNNLYWEFDGWSVGNPDLIPEHCWSFETGIHYKLNKNRLRFSSGMVLFQNNISNWIHWLADSNDVWKPENITEGLTQGVEFDASVSWNFSSLKVLLNGRYSYTIAKALKTGTLDIQPGKQMFYIPKHKACAGLVLAYKNYLVEYTQSFAGERNIDNTGGLLPAYFIGNLSQQFSIPLKDKMKFVIFMKINNIWDSHYQLKKSYAQALRQYIVGIKFLFN